MFFAHNFVIITWQKTTNDSKPRWSGPMMNIIEKLKNSMNITFEKVDLCDDWVVYVEILRGRRRWNLNLTVIKAFLIRTSDDICSDISRPNIKLQSVQDVFWYKSWSHFTVGYMFKKLQIDQLSFQNILFWNQAMALFI